eukprot:TRINITY_DN20320_c0_g1_i1.p1 TRINITY_DN20320_c0_g1~~TRINITY_DN20320_c0_g1_i1.p1  ORF type:complete len:394 (+),score=34.60 TRINITY_DN20320_c0_g1_i1:2-1183(+)
MFSLRTFALAVPVGFFAVVLIPFWVPVLLMAGLYYAVRYVWLVLTLSEWCPEKVVKLVTVSVEEILFVIRHSWDGIRIALGRKNVASRQYNTFKGTKMYMDIYEPATPSRKVLILIYGGAWSSGSRWGYTLTAKRLAKDLESTVIVPDYAYYPNAGMTEMAHQLYEVSAYVEAAYPSADIYWTGHSAGAHLVMLFFLRMSTQSVKMIETDREPLYPTPKRIFSGVGAEASPLPLPPHRVHFNKIPYGKVKGLVLIGGCYDIRKHLEWETARGVATYSGMKNAVFGHFEANSPISILEHLLKTHGPSKLRALLSDFPRTTIIHGSRDLTVSDGQSQSLYALLKSVSVPATYHHRAPVGHVDILTQLHSNPEPVLLEILKPVLSTNGEAPFKKYQ